jgi:hypothetical protein
MAEKPGYGEIFAPLESLRCEVCPHQNEPDKTEQENALFSFVVHAGS